MTHRISLSLIVAVTAWTFVCPLAHAEDAPVRNVSKAESYAAEAFEAYTTQDYDQAVALYRTALEATPSPDILYNLARIYDTKLKDRDQAVEYYARYAADPGAEPVRLRMVHERLAKLRELQAISQRSASQARASTPLASDSPGDETTGPSTPAEVPEQAQASGGLATAQILGAFVGAAGVAGIGVGVGFGVAARADATLAHEQCDGNACFTQRGVDAAKAAKQSATVSTVAFIAGGALVAGGVAMLVFGADEAEGQVAGLRVTPYAGPGSLGTHFAGQW